ncbi:ferric reductase-like transmembrane domain-containing protein [Actinomadura atramentaria]|uniref:ferric reductase-like transmembrane domain-containing protein n=1 Tax=Actinomadura atramentaria TaxID=1990 RepID=UPI000399BB8F|nr:ferric reductase-like transmembrane domain-containing protein [Actinomadura atramentaria]
MKFTHAGVRARRAPRRRRAETPLVPARTLLAAIGAGGGALVVLWIAQGVRPSSAADAFGAGARLAGLSAGYGLLVLVLLTARVPAIERGLGAGRLVRWHGLAGAWVLPLLAAHAALAIAARAADGGADAVRATLSGTAVAAGVSGALLLALAGAVAHDSVRDRVRPFAWRTAHATAYAGVALGFPHQPQGPDVGAHAALALLWTLLHAQVAVVVLWYRVAVPLRQGFRHGLRVVRVRREAPDVVSVVMAGRDLHLLRAEPGQYLRWRFLDRGLWWSALPFSLSAPPGDGTLRVTVRIVGERTARVARLRPGTRVQASGPFGAMTARRRTRRRVLLIAGGTGIAPLRALFETLPGGPGDVTLLYRASDASGLLLRGELERIATRRRARLHYLLDPPDRAPGDPLSPERLRALVPVIHRHDVYVCGPPGMTEHAVRALVRAGVARHHIHTESLT